MKYITNYFTRIPIFFILLFNALLGFLLSVPTIIAIFYYGDNYFFGEVRYSTLQEKIIGLGIELIIILCSVLLNLVFYKLIKKAKIVHKNISRKSIVILVKFFSTVIIFLYFSLSSITLPILFSFFDLF